jgi:MFS family permease
VVEVETQRRVTRDPVGADWPALRRNRDFIVVLVGQGISALGDAVSFTAVPLLVLRLTGSGGAVGVIGALQFVPDLLVGVAAGAYADRWDRRRMMFIADLGRAILTALIPLSFVLGWPTVVVLLLVVGPINVLRVFFMAAFTAAVPNLVGRRRIAAGTSAFEAVAAFGFIAGPAIAGVLSATIGPALTLGLDATSFAVSAATLLLVTRPFSEAREAPVSPRLGSEIRAGISFIARQPVLRLAVAFYSTYVILFSAWPAVMLFYVTVDRRLAVDAYGLVIAGYGAGGLMGTLVAARVIGRRVGVTVLLGAVAAGALTIVTATQASVSVLLALTVVASIGDILVVVGYATLRATVTPDRLLGRVASTSRTLSNCGQALGYLGAGLLLDRFGGTGTLVMIGGGVVTAACLFALAAPLRTASTDAPG